jgi:hypothetical protein
MNGRCLAVAAGLVMACSDGGAEPSTVLTRTAPADRAQCPHGGTVVESGVDRDGDDALDDSEVAARAVLCLDAPGAPPPVLTRHRAEPPGDACPRGGTAIEAGPDRDGDGILDDDEVATVSRVCAGAVLSRIEAAPPLSAQCPAGGLLVHVGHDDDGNGQLDPVEIEHTEADCDDVFERDLELRTQRDVALMQGVRVVAGRLTLSGAGLGDVALPALERVDAGLLVSSSAGMARLSLPALTAIGGPVDIQNNPSLVTLAMPALTAIGGHARVRTNAGLEQLELGALAEIGAELLIESNPRLTAVDLAALAQVGTRPGLPRDVDLSIADNAALAELALALVACRDRDVMIRGNPLLSALALTCPGARTMVVASNPALASIRVGAGDARPDGAVSIERNPALTHLVVDAVHLPSLVVEAAALTAIETARPGGDAPVIEGLEVTAPLTAVPAAQVTGRLTLRATQLATIDLPAVGSLGLDANPLLETVHVAAVASDILVSANPALAEVAIARTHFPDGAPVTRGTVWLEANPALARAPWIADLGQVRTLRVLDNPRLAMPAALAITVTGGSLRLASAVGLERLDVSAAGFHDLDLFKTDLREVRLTAQGTPELTAAWLRITDNGLLERVDIAANLRAGLRFEVASNAALRHLTLAGTTRLAQVIAIVDNPALPACLAQAVLDAIEAASEQQSGNDDDAPCDR